MTSMTQNPLLLLLRSQQEAMQGQAEALEGAAKTLRSQATFLSAFVVMAEGGLPIAFGTPTTYEELIKALPTAHRTIANGGDVGSTFGQTRAATVVEPLTEATPEIVPPPPSLTIHELADRLLSAHGYSRHKQTAILRAWLLTQDLAFEADELVTINPIAPLFDPDTESEITVWLSKAQGSGKSSRLALLARLRLVRFVESQCPNCAVSQKVWSTFVTKAFGLLPKALMGQVAALRKKDQYPLIAALVPADEKSTEHMRQVKTEKATAASVADKADETPPPSKPESPPRAHAAEFTRYPVMDADGWMAKVNSARAVLPTDRIDKATNRFILICKMNACHDPRILAEKQLLISLRREHPQTGKLADTLNDCAVSWYKLILAKTIEVPSIQLIAEVMHLDAKQAKQVSTYLSSAAI